MDSRELLKSFIGDVTFTPEEEVIISNNLKESGNPDHLITLDGSEEYTAPLINVGVQLFISYLESGEKEKDLLNEACDCGSYDALTKRCLISREVILSDDTTEDDKIQARKLLMQDVNRLGDLYWFVGYIYACRILLGIANHFDLKQSASSQKDEVGDHLASEGDDAIDAHLFHEEAAKFYYRAKILFVTHIQISDKLVDIIYRGKGFTECGWKSIEEAEKHVLSPLDSKRQFALFERENREMKKILHENKHITIRK